MDAGLRPYVKQRIVPFPQAAILAAMKTHLADETIYRVTEKQPDVDDRVIVIASGFRCLGYIDEAGIWRHDTDSAPIGHALMWLRRRRP